MSETLRGIPASPGIAIARAFVAAGRPDARERPVRARREAASNPVHEHRRFAEAVALGRAELVTLRDRTRSELGDLKAEIFEAHLSILGDPELSAAVSRNIDEEGMDAAAAVDAAAQVFIDLLGETGDDLFKGRIDDIRDLRSRILSHLGGANGGGADDRWAGMDGEVVVVAEDLSPSETTQLDRALVKAFATSGGSTTSHSSILARSMEIPAVVGLAGLPGRVRAGELLIVDGSAGIVILDPQPLELESYRAAAACAAASAKSALRFASRPTTTRDGMHVELGANIGGPADVDAALARGAEAVGLFRTEFLYMDRPELPTEDEQFEAYREVLHRLAPRPVVIRTLDVGGDKELPALPLDKESNPFLGVRAIRLCLSREALFRTQLRALLRAGPHGNLHIMFPMIATLEELRRAKRILEEERAALAETKAKLAPRVAVGIMIEIPAAATMADQLAREADFFSVGTNDLVQYSMAADRMNPKLAYLNQGLHPAILRVLGQVADAAVRAGIWAGICGELAADRLALPILLGLGLRELSMNSASIPASRELIAAVDSEKARVLSIRARELETAQQVRDLVEEHLKTM